MRGERGREGGREMSPSTSSFLRCPQQPGLGQAGAGVSHVSDRPRLERPHHCLEKEAGLEHKWDGKQVLCHVMLLPEAAVPLLQPLHSCSVDSV